MSDSLRDRIAAVVNLHYGLQFCQCGWRYDPKLDSSYADHVADAVMAELPELQYVDMPHRIILGDMPEIPGRSFMDDHGRTWEWCGGVEGTWAWRITDLGIAHV